MAETKVSPQDAEDIALSTSIDDTPYGAQIRRSLVRKFATTSAFMGAAPNEFPHLAADVAMAILGPALEMAAADAEATVSKIKRDVGGAAEALVSSRLQVIEAAARASERAACVAFLRGEAAHLAAAALAARGPEVAVVAKDAAALSLAARRLASRTPTAQ